MQNDSDWVNDLFNSHAQDWSTVAAHGAVVICVPFLSDTEVSKRCSHVLSDTELRRARQFVTEDEKVHFLQRRAFRRYCGALALGSAPPLSQVQFTETEKGRPYLLGSPDIWFSFSSCRFGFLGAWSALRAIGIDYEDTTRKIEPKDLARQFFSKAEAEAIESVHGPARLRLFWQLWCLKEAALKSIGEGLPFGLDAFEFEITLDIHVVHAPHDLGGPGVFGAYLRQEADSCAAFVIRNRSMKH